jgi:hypothetical protein
MTMMLRGPDAKSHVMTEKQLLLAELGGQERLARLKAVYQNARPRRGRWGPCILTADEVFRQKAKEDGFSDEGIAMFLDHVNLWSNP